MNTRSIGTHYEELVCKYLISYGVQILEKNYTCKFGEVDIIGFKDNTLIFFEVKYRKDEQFGNALCAIGKSKQKRIINCAKYYTAFKEYDCFIRFDAIGITNGKIEWIKDAFWM